MCPVIHPSHSSTRGCQSCRPKIGVSPVKRLSILELSLRYMMRPRQKSGHFTLTLVKRNECLNQHWIFCVIYFYVTSLSDKFLRCSRKTKTEPPTVPHWKKSAGHRSKYTATGVGGKTGVNWSCSNIRTWTPRGHPFNHGADWNWRT